MPKMTDQQFEEAVKAAGQEVTEASQEAMRKMEKETEDSLKTVTANLKGVSTELHAKIDEPKLKKGDFAFTLPVGSVLKKSLF